MSKFIEEAKQVFADYPKQPSVFFTEDGSAFVNEMFAKAHARTIGKLKYETITREEAEKGEKNEQDKPLNKGYATMTVADLKEAISGRQLEIGNAKVKADLISILEADDKAKADAEKATTQDEE